MNSAQVDAERSTPAWEARAREAMARILCDMAGSDPDFAMWDGQPLWKWMMHGAEAKARIQAAIDALTTPQRDAGADGGHRWV